MTSSTLKNIILSFIKRLSNDRLSKWSLKIITLFIIIGFLAPLISNDLPIICKKDGKWYIPIVYQKALITKQQFSLHTNDFEFCIPPLVPYSSVHIDNKNTNSVSPFATQNVSSWHKHHWLGTDLLGRDVLAGIIHGCSVAFSVGFYSTIIALFIGLLLGGFAGFLGDHSYKASLLWICLSLVLSFIYIYYLFYFCTSVSFSLLLLIVLFIALYISMVISKKTRLREVTIPLDLIIFRIIEVYKTIPDLLILFVLLGILGTSSIWTICLIIGMIRWVSVARFFRAEVMNIKKLPFIDAARASGMNQSTLFFKHILPNSIRPILVHLAFGFSIAIILESTLSFLGLGLGIDQVTWGSILSEARHDLSAWWLVVIPGACIFAVVASFNKIAETLNEILDPKSR